MSHLLRSFILLVVVVLITALVPIFGCPSRGEGQSNLTSRVAELEDSLITTRAELAFTREELADVKAKIVNIRVETEDINGLSGPHLIFEGCNVHIRSGSGDTEDSSGLTGLGNLVIGYNEPPSKFFYGRFGSHNLVIGRGHEYPGYAGFVTGFYNVIDGKYASVSGGFDNHASGTASSVSGGLRNTASGFYASVSGGEHNTADANASSVSGGYGNSASDGWSSVSGGLSNKAAGESSSVSGGHDRDAIGPSDWVAGGLFQDN